MCERRPWQVRSQLDAVHLTAFRAFAPAESGRGTLPPVSITCASG